uniref:hypothetical protein n=1 Tax=Haoranjiania flava TaxID=1856322 RepID=UPI0036D33BC6
MLSLPTSRTKILNAKFTLYIIWCLLLVLSNLLLAFFFWWLLKLSLLDTTLLAQSLTAYLLQRF